MWKESIQNSKNWTPSLKKKPHPKLLPDVEKESDKVPTTSSIYKNGKIGQNNNDDFEILEKLLNCKHLKHCRDNWNIFVSKPPIAKQILNNIKLLKKYQIAGNWRHSGRILEKHREANVKNSEEHLLENLGWRSTFYNFHPQHQSEKKLIVISSYKSNDETVLALEKYLKLIKILTVVHRPKK